MGDVEFARERLTPALWAEVMPLLLAQHDETYGADGPALVIDVARYETLDAADVLHLYTARAGSTLVGYASYTIAPSLRVKRIEATHDSLYVLPEHRDGATGMRLMVFADRSLAESGAALIRQCARNATRFAAVLEAVGYEAVGTIYEKHLGETHGR